MVTHYNYDFVKKKDEFIFTPEQETTVTLYYVSSKSAIKITSYLVKETVSMTVPITKDGEYKLLLEVENRPTLEVYFTSFKNLQNSIIAKVKKVLCPCGDCPCEDKDFSIQRDTLTEVLAFQTLFLDSYGEDIPCTFTSFLNEAVKSAVCKIQDKINSLLLEEYVYGHMKKLGPLSNFYLGIYWAGMYFIEKQEAGTDEDQQDFLLTKFRYKDITKCLCGLCISMEDLETIFNKDIVTPEEPEEPEELEVYYFQFDSLSLAIGDSALVTTDWLAANATKIVESAFLDGIVVPLPTIGRIGFTIKADTGTYSIYDELGQNVTDIVFNTTTDVAEGRQIFISKEYYAYSTLYYQLIKN